MRRADFQTNVPTTDVLKLHDQFSFVVNCPVWTSTEQRSDPVKFTRRIDAVGCRQILVRSPVASGTECKSIEEQ